MFRLSFSGATIWTLLPKKQGTILLEGEISDLGKTPLNGGQNY